MGLFTGPSSESVNDLALAIRQHSATQTGLGSELSRITRVLEGIRKELEELNSHWPPNRPGLLTLRMLAERMDGMLTFVVTVPAEPESQAAEVVSREASVTVGDGLTQTSALEGSGDAEVGPFEGAQDTAVTVSVVNIDDAGNRSEPRTQSFVLVDTIPPAAPGEIGLRVTGETA